VLVYRLFFANASYVKGRVREALYGAPSPVRWFVTDAKCARISREAGVLDLVGEAHVYPTVRAAVAAAASGEEQS
jgi:hypothetical protein